MNKSKAIAWLIWAIVLFYVCDMGLDLPKAKIFVSVFDNSPPAFQIFVVLFPFGGMLPLAFFQRHRAVDWPFLRRIVDSRFGTGTFQQFLFDLKPIALTTAIALVTGIAGLWSTFESGGSLGGYIHCGFYFSGGLGLLSAYLLSLKYSPRLI